MTSMSYTFLRFLNCIFYTFLRFFLGAMYENGQFSNL